jgi:hypothetical protein
MIHFTCDLCRRDMDAENELRFVVKLEVYAAFDPLQEDGDDDRDHLQEIHEILERSEIAESPDISEEVYQQLRYDLCPECRKRFMKNPLGRKHVEQFDFSQN